MRGSVVKRGDGYSVVVELDRDPITGKRRQKWHSGYRTKRDAERALSEIVASVHSGTYVSRPSRRSPTSSLIGWPRSSRRSGHRRTTRYARNLRLHVLPQLGSVQLRRVDAGMLNALVCRAAGRREADDCERRRRWPVTPQRPLYPHHHPQGVP